MEPPRTDGAGSPPSGGGGDPPEPAAPVGLLSAPVPPDRLYDLAPADLEHYVRAAMHQERTPGDVLVVLHPHKRVRVPRGLMEQLEGAGFRVEQVETQADRVTSVRAIHDALLALGQQGRALDVIVVSGDGTLDHHFMIAAFWAFYPDLVRERPGCISCEAVSEEDLATLPERYRSAFFERLPDPSGLDPTEALVTRIWLLRSAVEPALRRGQSVQRVLKRARRKVPDLPLRLAVLSCFLPHRVVLRPHGFDVSGLAQASQERTFRGLYPYIRSLLSYPAGTAADNAVFAGVPGWLYGRFAGLLDRLPGLDWLRRRWERRVSRRFLAYFLREGVVVPARLSVVAIDGHWQRISSHAAGGPAAGRFFTADLTSKTGGMAGYLVRIPQVILQEGILGSTVVRLRSRYADGTPKSRVESQLAEGLYTNRTFIGGVGSVPTTDPTSFAGQSSLVVIPPILGRDLRGLRVFDIRGLLAFTEAIAKGVAARALHAAGLAVGRLAGGGRFLSMPPDHQVAIKEGEAIDMRYLTREGHPRAVPLQVSGDPFQGWSMNIRVAWAPVPLLAAPRSLLFASTRSTLNDLRLQQSYQLEGLYIGGQYYFRHGVGLAWTSPELASSGLLPPLRHLPWGLGRVQRLVQERWRDHGAGEFVDTTEYGLKPGRRARFSQSGDQRAHLVVLKEPHRMLLVRKVRIGDDGTTWESRTRYRSTINAWIIDQSQILATRGQAPPQLVREEHYFLDAEAFQRVAPAFFPVERK